MAKGVCEEKGMGRMSSERAAAGFSVGASVSRVTSSARETEIAGLTARRSTSNLLQRQIQVANLAAGRSPWRAAGAASSPAPLRVPPLRAAAMRAEVRIASGIIPSPTNSLELNAKCFSR